MVNRSDTFARRLSVILIAFVFLLQGSPSLHAQQSPDFPVSYRIFNPFIMNPAITGSKDFMSADLLISNFGKDNSQLLSSHTRLSKSDKEYFTSVATPRYTKIGVGAYLFDEFSDPTRNVGIGVSGSYHFKLNRNALSYISVGASAKAIFNRYSGNPDAGSPAASTIKPNVDAGFFYYSPSISAGISATNILGTPDSPDSLGVYQVPISRQYFLHAGYKFILSKSMNLMLEPSLLVNTGDSIPENIIDIFKPGLKIYSGDVCIGTYFNNFDKISFFGQFKYKKTSLGAYFELPYKTAYFRQPIIVELSIGINLSAIKTGNTRRNHW